jgi:hypothetical protein
LFSSFSSSEISPGSDTVINENFEEIENIIYYSCITYDEDIECVTALNLHKATGGILVPQHFVYGLNVLLPFIC